MDAARALAEVGADMNQTDPDGTTATVVAIITAHFDLAAMLADKGADLNVADITGMTALYAAVDMHTLGSMLSRPGPKVTDELDAAPLLPVLVKHGANPNANRWTNAFAPDSREFLDRIRVCFRHASPSL